MIAKEKRAFVVINVLEMREEKIKNSTYPFNKNGEIAFVCDKAHLSPSEALYKKSGLCYNSPIKIRRYNEMEMKEKTLYEQARLVIEEIAGKAGLKRGQILVIGCSTSEIVGAKIGTNSAPAVAAEVFAAFYDYAKENGIYLAVQCCEHLNRAIVTERAAVAGLETVNVVPQPKAGGSMATQAYAVDRGIGVFEVKLHSSPPPKNGEFIIAYPHSDVNQHLRGRGERGVLIGCYLQSAPCVL